MRRSTLASLLLLGVFFVPAANAQPTTSVQLEVSFLLGYIEGSGCDFYRNGTWHDSKAAQAHIRDKYKFLAQSNLIASTEQFIGRAATGSSLSGQPYKVRCRGLPETTSAQWLGEELARLRTY